MPIDPSLPDVFTRLVAAEAGLTRNQVERRLESGRWRRLVQGAFCQASQWERSAPHERHLLLARAVLLTRGEPDAHALSHVSAAVLHGLPVSHQLLDTVWTTTPAGLGRSTRYSPLLRREVAPLPARQVTAVAGLPVTTLARTLADCLRHLDLLESVPMADAALYAQTSRLDGLSLNQVARVLDEQASWPYAHSARRALPLVDGRRESVLESRSALTMAAHGLPAPQPQARIVDASGRFVARVDFLWKDRGVVGEADGAGKYRTDDPARVIQEEKDRQARLEALGLVVVRWDWRHLVGDPPELVVRLLRALEAGDGRRFRGLVA